MVVLALAGGVIALIIAGGVLLALALIAFAIWAHQYTKVGPNEVLIISGRKGRKKGPGYRIVRGGGTYVRPFREKVQRLSLELMQFDVRSAETYTMHGVAGLGRRRTARVKRAAIGGEAEAGGEAKAARYEADLAIEDSRRAYETERGRYKAEGLRASAEADLSYDLQRAITRQQVRAEELKVEIVERQKAIDLMKAEVERRKRELEAEIVEPAVAKAREITAVADAHREEAAAIGAGEAGALPPKGLAEAEAMAAKAKSWGDYNEGAITDRVPEILPQLASAVA